MATISQEAEQKKDREYRPPDEVFELTKHLQASQWTSQDDKGRTWFRYKFERVNPCNQADPYRTLLPSDLLELPEAIAKLASHFAQYPELSDGLKGSLKTLNANMKAVKEPREATRQIGEANGSGVRRVLTF
jgi:hypothetical protein